MQAKPSFSYTASELTKMYVRPLVYGWRRGNEYLYIGKTLHGLKRIFKHEVLPSIETLPEDDVIDIWYCSELEVGDLELGLIAEHKPKLNNGPRTTTRKKVYFVGPAIPLDPNRPYKEQIDEIEKARQNNFPQ